MSQQLDLLVATGTQPIYEFIKFSDYDPAYTGQLRVRVNPSRRVWKEITDAYNKREQDAEGTLRAMVQLVTRDADDPAPMEYAEFKEKFIDNDEIDLQFSTWIVDQINAKVIDRFLAHRASTMPSATN